MDDFAEFFAASKDAVSGIKGQAAPGPHRGALAAMLLGTVAVAAFWPRDRGRESDQIATENRTSQTCAERFKDDIREASPRCPGAERDVSAVYARL